MLKTEIRPAPVAPGNVILQAFPDGSLRVRNTTPLGPYPRSLTERLEHWAAVVPDRLFLAERDGDGWRNVTYRDALNAARAIDQVLLDRGLSATRPVLIGSQPARGRAAALLECAERLRGAASLAAPR